MFHDPTFWVAVAFVIIVAAVFRPVGRTVLGAVCVSVISPPLPR